MVGGSFKVALGFEPSERALTVSSLKWAEIITHIHCVNGVTGLRHYGGRKRKEGRVANPAFQGTNQKRPLYLMRWPKVRFERFLHLGRQLIEVDTLLLNFSTQALRASGGARHARYQILGERL